jgi:catechol 2,3-dioxygenase-like lactoylglutathione lyase family enzyme/uncharacterized damage-inducible protein DinB
MAKGNPIFNQVNLVGREVTAMVEFYERMGVEFEPTVPPWDRHHRTFAASSVTEGFDFDLDSQAFVTEWNEGWSAGRSGPVLGFRVSSSEAVDQTYQELTDAGYRGQQRPSDGFMGARYAVVADPDGNSVGLMGPIDPGRARIPPAPAERTAMSSPVEDLADARRAEPDFVLPERQMLEGWLEFHRTTLLLKCEGLDDDRRKARPIPSSKLSLHGLVRHMADVERTWFTRTLLSQPDVPPLFFRRGPEGEADDSDFFPLDEADWEHDLAAWQDECEHSRDHAARNSLDDTGSRRGRQYSLRWIYVHMVEEYARHNGHADLIRELVDGAVGW